MQCHRASVANEDGTCFDQTFLKSLMVNASESGNISQILAT